MIRVNLPDKTLGISFRHSKVDVPIPQTAKEKKEGIPVQFRKTMGTFCEIYEITTTNVGERKKWICEGSATLGVGDQFRKAEGRKWALTRALNLLRVPKFGEARAINPIILGRKERRLVWEAYHNRGKNEVKSEGEN